MVNDVDTLEQRVIKGLGLELAQARVDIAFLRARLEAVREVVVSLMDLQKAMLSSPALEGVEPPPGMTFMPGDVFMTLTAVLS